MLQYSSRSYSAVDENDEHFILITKTGKQYSFHIKSLAELYQSIEGGIMLEESNNQLDKFCNS